MEKFDEKDAFARTRKSLIERLADWEDQRTWDEFYQTYWRLIYSVSVKAGLGREEAFDVVQETVLAVAKQWKKGQVYDPEKGSFKTWLMNITRWRIADQFRLKQRNPAAMNQAGGTPGADGNERRTGTIERIEGENGLLRECRSSQSPTQPSRWSGDHGTCVSGRIRPNGDRPCSR